MTAPVRISQRDMDRAAKTAAKALKRGEFENARIIFDLAAARIEIVIGDAGEPSIRSANPWDDE